MKANEIIEAIKNGNEALYRSEKDRTIGIISERVRNKQSITEQRGWLDAISHAYWSYLAPGVAVKPEQVERTGYAARIITEEIGKGNLPADAVNY